MSVIADTMQRWNGERALISLGIFAGTHLEWLGHGLQAWLQLQNPWQARTPVFAAPD
jgi:hypothetical protein